MAETATITVFRGQRYTLNFTMTPTTDITGWTLAFNVAKSANHPTKLIDDKAMSITLAAAGTFSVALTPTETNVKPGSYYWDAWRTNSGYETCLAYGTFTVMADAKYPES